MSRKTSEPYTPLTMSTEFSPEDGPVVQSQTTFETPIVTAPTEAKLNRSVTIWASGSVTIDDALDVGHIDIKKEDILEAIGVGPDSYLPGLDKVFVSHYFNPTSQRLGVRVVQGKKNVKLVEDQAHGRNPTTQKMEGFTTIIPSQVQGNLSQELRPVNSAKDISAEELETRKKWIGLRTEDLTDGVMATSIPDPENPGQTKIVKYDVPLVKQNGEPQPLAYMLEKNKEQFPGFQGDEIRSKIHDFEGVHYYSVPPQYLNFLVGSMQEHIIDKQSLTLDDDLRFEIYPLTPIMNSQMRNAKGEARKEPLERMIAIQLDFANLDLSEE